MTTDDNVKVEDYKNSLKELTGNHKLKINLLTILADDYSDCSQQIVDCVIESAFQAPPPLKLVHLYLIDSISKNVGAKGGYAIKFSNKIADLFVHVFLQADDKTRGAMYKLRNTWVNVYPRGKLYMIDLKIHELDNNWPVHSLSTSGALSTTAPRPPNPRPPQTAQTTIHVNPRFIERAQNPPQKLVSPPKTDVPQTKNEAPKTVPNNRSHFTDSQSSMASTSSSSSTKSADSPLKAPVTMGAALKTLGKKKEEPQKIAPKVVEKKAVAPKVKKISDLGPIPRKKVEIKQEVKEEVDKTTEKIRKIKKEITKQRRESPTGVPEKKKKLPPKGIPEVRQERGESWKIPQNSRSEPRRPIQNNHINRPQASASPPILVPTAAPGSHAFNLPPQPPISRAPPAHFPPNPNYGPRPPFNGTPPFGAPQFSGPPPPFFNPPTSANSTPISVQSLPPNPGNPMPAHIKNETPRLPNVPGNNRIFVDGKAYEVIYLENEAVIERNGVPHRISFCGPARDVIIDGVAHRMAFGETKEVNIDGHIHRLRFGAPSRELYMGDFPFKGAFGGPPIMATINGKRHEIRLMGPPPEVKIDQDPCYELMRHMQNARQNDGKKEEKKDMSITELLSKLQKSGVLNQIGDKAKTPPASSPIPASRKSPSPVSDEPIIPSKMKLDKSVELDAPAVSLAEFGIEQLQMRYKSVTRDLSEKRSACPDCGIEIEKMDSPEYRRHLDGHLQSELNAKQENAANVRTRPAYQSEEEFIAYSETEEVNHPQISPEAEEKMEIGDEEDQGRDVLSNETELRECSECCEPFEEYFDHDSDEWRLRDCIIVGDKAFHRACKMDVPTSTV
ncbi:unnamed protein product [Bursaphelenchus xylophilus]|uniref:(pine wood nematode) hypothetical protein n=1 Tax=Bursaphelenchus xylophilus TaxID=6326 RepID=A0A1I7RLH9_BURXY|nr:unnamed protein product [Bursaphelenchus xylophilus]CAG9082968.1 unnamed protein product [Bursaphelenchus xylophilus]